MKQDRAAGGLIDIGKKVENGGLTGTVGSNETGDFRLADSKGELVHCGQTAEVDTQVADVQNRLLAQITFGDDDVCRHWHHLCLLLLTHFAASFLEKSFFNFFFMVILNCWKRVLAPRTMTRIRTTA